MKKQLFYLSSLLVFVVLFGSCGKYEDGPSISLRTKTSRISGDWKTEKNFYNGVEQQVSPDSQNSVFTFEKDGTGKMTLTLSGVSLSGDLEWEFGSGKETLKVRTKNTDGTWGEWDESTILRLTNSELWIKDVPTGTTNEYITHLAKV